jgi:hypothetical protein
MLLETSGNDFHKMEIQLTTVSVPGKIPLAAPEQDYITRYYVEGWNCLDIQWNYQLHQLAFCSRYDSDGVFGCVQATRLDHERSTSLW